MSLKVEEKSLASYIESSRDSYEKELKELVDIPGVSMEPDRLPQIRQTANLAKSILEKHGAEVEIHETKGYPVLIAEFKSDEKHPTVAVYNHLDVQPADPKKWNSTPFEMKIEGDKYLGRGTTDDKGPALAVLYAAKFAHENKFPLNIKFIWELEEEIGSPSFEEFLKANIDKAKADSIVISDTVWLTKDKPAMPYGLRGLASCMVRLKTAEKNVHSGEVGGLARNPIAEICELLASCQDAKTGEVKIPGFYDDVVPLSDEELNGFVDSGFTATDFKKSHQLTHLRTEDPKDGAHRIWGRPTFEVHGITGGYNGPGVKTIVPYDAEAKVSMRLVPNQNPEKIQELFSNFVKEHCPDAEVEFEGALKPFVAEYQDKYSQAGKKATSLALGVDPAFIREGGSIGAVVSMKEAMNVPIVFLGLSLPEHGYHAINENFDWGQASCGMKVFSHYFKLLSELD